MTVTKKQAQAALCKAVSFSDSDARAVLQAAIDAMPDEPETRAEMLGRVCMEAYEAAIGTGLTNAQEWIAAAAAVEQQCRPREVTEGRLSDMLLGMLRTDDFYYHAATRINTYIRGEDA